jgi:phosphoglycerate dehydrogenase-like enzyme
MMAKMNRRLGSIFLSALLILFTGYSLAQEFDEEKCLLCDQAEVLIARFNLEESETPVRERPNWRRPLKIVTEGGENAASFFGTIAPDAEVIGVDDPEEAVEHIADADVYFISLCSEEIIAKGTNLRWVHKFAAGVDDCVSIPDFAERGILLTNTRRVYALPIAQHAIALMLALANKLPEYYSEQASGQWEKYFNPYERGHIELEGKTMFVVGLGGIGTEIARRGHGLGMRVIATRRSSRAGPDFVDYVGLSHEMTDLAGQADVVVNALPLTDETRRIFDRNFFNSLPQGALFVNIGRGETVNTTDLVAALESGHLAGAGLDVTDPEPLPEGHKLWSLPNVILTPHVANSSDMTRVRAGTVAVENLRRYIQGRRVLNVVDLDAGY